MRPQKLGGRFGYIYIFFFFRGRGKGGGVRGGGRGGRLQLKMGGYSRTRRGKGAGGMSVQGRGGQNIFFSGRKSRQSANRVYPYPLGARLARPNPKKGAPDRKSFIHSVYSGQRGIETMVSDHGLGRGQTMGYGVDPSLINQEKGSTYHIHCCMQDDCRLARGQQKTQRPPSNLHPPRDDDRTACRLPTLAVQAKITAPGLAKSLALAIAWCTQDGL